MSASGRSAFEPRDSHYRERCRASFARQGAMALIGASIAEIEPGLCEVHLPYRDELSQQHGYFHGGILTAIADSATGYAAFSLASPEATVLTVEFKVNFLAPAEGERLVARGEIIKSGRTLSVGEARVHVERGGVRRLCATMNQTVMTVYGRDERR